MPPAVQSITDLPQAPAEEQADRARKYLVMMAIRTACFLLVFVVDGWLRIVPVVLATVLPYIAVVVANVVGSRGAEPARPVGPVETGPRRIEA